MDFPIDLVERAKKIKVLITDVDGVLTAGNIIYDNNGLESKHFNVKDGFAIKRLQNFGIKTGVITGRNSKVVAFRCEELKFDFHYHGASKKREQYELVKKNFDVSDEEVAYIGDDVIDLPILSRCGLAVCPADVFPYMHNYAHMVATRKGGEGVYREVADLIIWSQGHWDTLIQEYLNQ